MKQLYIAGVCMMIGISSLSAQSDIVSDTSVIYPSLKSFVLRGGLDTAGRTIALITQLNLIDSAGKDYGVLCSVLYHPRVRLTSIPGTLGMLLLPYLPNTISTAYCKIYLLILNSIKFISPIGKDCNAPGLCLLY